MGMTGGVVVGMGARASATVDMVDGVIVGMDAGVEACASAWLGVVGVGMGAGVWVLR